MLEPFPEDGILVAKDSTFEPDISSGRSSEDVVEGASVDSKDPTWYGVTGISVREDAEGLYLTDPKGWSNLQVEPNLQCPFCK